MNKAKLSGEARALEGELISLRRHFHQYPELGFEERKTAGFIAAYLRQLGLEVREGIAGTGVTGLLRGAREGKTILYRADMDALPIREENDTPYRSKYEGVSHMCGHDAHMAIALGAAKLLASKGETLPGGVLFLFQPGEERAPGGARPMIEEGVMENPKVNGVIGLHVWQSLPAGTVSVKPGPVFAAVDHVNLKVKGKGGHGALPQHTVDPILVSAQIVTSLQALVTREIDPLKPVVFTFGSVHAGAAPNVIPEEAFLQGTLRYFDQDVHDLAIERIRRMAEGIAGAFGARCEVEITGGYPPLVNDPGFTHVVSEAAREVLRSDAVFEDVMTMGSEDMALFLDRSPGCFFLLGSSNGEKGLSEPHHSPRFDIDEDVLALGLEIVTRAIVKFQKE